MVLIRRTGEQAWRSPKSSTYPNEEALEVLLATSPELLPAVSASSLVVARQVQTGVGPVDLLGIGVDGSVVVVECKLHANPEIRRAVVGQLFAYASAIWQTPPASFEQAVSARLGRPLLEAVQALAGGGIAGTSSPSARTSSATCVTAASDSSLPSTRSPMNSSGPSST